MWDPNLLTTLAETLPLGIWIGDGPTGRPLYCNALFTELMGVRPIPETEAGTFAQAYRLHDEEGRPYPEERLPCARATREGSPQVSDDLVVHRTDGVRRNLRCWAQPVFSAQGELDKMILMFEDHTRERAVEVEREEAELRSRRDARMEAVGRLATGLALDFNNLLATAQILVSTLKVGERDPVRRQDLAQVQEALTKAVQLTRSLKTFSSRKVLPEGRLSVRDAVEAVANLVRRMSDGQVEVGVEQMAGRDVVSGDVGEIEQALLGLANRARSSMPEGGRLTLRTSDLLLGEHDAMRRPPLKPGWHVVIDVIDNGATLPPAARERIFEPYLGPAPTGTPAAGLGLARAYGTIQSHGGTLDVLVNHDGGSTMRVLLPAVDAKPSKATPAPTLRRGTGRILVADDDPMVLGATETALRTLGYEVVTARDGVEALERYEGDGGIDAVVLDLVMPRMGGLETLQALRAMDPRVRVLITTGLDAAEVPGVTVGTVQRYLNKPFGIEELSTALAGVLQR